MYNGHNQVFSMSSQVKKSRQCQLRDKKHQLFHCQQTQSLLITVYNGHESFSILIHISSKL
jgi:hypothetical protein